MMLDRNGSISGFHRLEYNAAILLALAAALRRDACRSGYVAAGMLTATDPSFSAMYAFFSALPLSTSHSKCGKQRTVSGKIWRSLHENFDLDEIPR